MLFWNGPGVFKTSKPEQNDRHFTYRMFKCAFMHEHNFVFYSHLTLCSQRFKSECVSRKKWKDKNKNRSNWINISQRNIWRHTNFTVIKISMITNFKLQLSQPELVSSNQCPIVLVLNLFCQTSLWHEEYYYFIRRCCVCHGLHWYDFRISSVFIHGIPNDYGLPCIL